MAVLWNTKEEVFPMEKKPSVEKQTTPMSTSGDTLIHNFDNKKESFFSGKFFGLLFVALLLGLGTGYLLAQNGKPTLSSNSVQNASDVTKGMIVGSNDTATFKDVAEGKLAQGGIEGEGQFHLERPGGESQNVYMTSSTVDLSKFVGRKIKVWGQTQTAQKAGWLMDVGRVEVLE